MSGKVTIASKNTLFCKKENRLLSGSRSNRVCSSNQPYCFVKSDSEVGHSRIGVRLIVINLLIDNDL